MMTPVVFSALTQRIQHELDYSESPKTDERTISK